LYELQIKWAYNVEHLVVEQNATLKKCGCKR